MRFFTYVVVSRNIVTNCISITASVDTHTTREGIVGLALDR